MTGSESVDDRTDGGAGKRIRPIAYRALGQDLREAIERGDFGRAGQLPTEAQLSAERRVSRQTVRRALQDLVADGLVYRVQGRGTFVSGLPVGREYVQSVSSIDDIEALPEGVAYEVVEALRQDIDVEAAGRMRLPSDEVYTGCVRRLFNGTAFMVSRVWLPPAVGRLVAADGFMSTVGVERHEALVHVVERLWPRTIVGAQQSVTAVAAPEDVARMLEMEPGSPALRIDRLFHDTAGEPTELATSFCSPSRYSYRLALRRSLGK